METNEITNLLNSVKMPKIEISREEIEELHKISEDAEMQKEETIKSANSLLAKGFTPEMILELNKIQSENLGYHYKTFSILQHSQDGFIQVMKEFVKVKEDSFKKATLHALGYVLVGVLITTQWDNIKPFANGIYEVGKQFVSPQKFKGE